MFSHTFEIFIVLFGENMFAKGKSNETSAALTFIISGLKN